MPRIIPNAPLNPDAVRLDLTSAEGIEKSLRSIHEAYKGDGTKEVKVLFCRQGDDYYAVKEGEGPGFWQSRWNKLLSVFCCGTNSTYFANDKVGNLIAEHIPGEVGLRLRSSLNGCFYRKTPIDSKILATACDNEIDKRVGAVRELLREHARTVDADGFPLLEDAARDTCEKHIDAIRSAYVRRDKAYADAYQELRRLEINYRRFGGRAQALNGKPTKKAGIDTTGLSQSESVAWNIVWRIASFKITRNERQSPQIEKSVREILADNNLMNDKQIQTLIDAGRVNRGMLTALEKAERTGTLHETAERYLNRANVLRQRKLLNKRLDDVENRDKDQEYVNEIARSRRRLIQVDYFPVYRLQQEELNDINVMVGSLERATPVPNLFG